MKEDITLSLFIQLMHFVYEKTGKWEAHSVTREDGRNAVQLVLCLEV
jgi:hypothetical protein